MLFLKESSLDWALTHIENYGDTNIFPIPFEFDAIRYNWESDIKPYLVSQDMLTWKVRPYRRCLTPKHRYGFRIATQLDPLDTIVFTALIAEIGKDIESSRLPVTKSICYSSRFKPLKDGRMFDASYNYQAFQDHSAKLSEDSDFKYVVVADIADFFPRIYSHPLENALQDCTKKTDHATAAKNMLKAWNYTISIGIPVGVSITMLLSELILDDIDRGLHNEGVTHCRYVDDFRFFCKTEKEAYEQLSLLANILYENQALTLQQHKTSILPMGVFKDRFLESEDKKELSSLSMKLNELLKELGITNPYEEIDYYDLPEEYQQDIDELNLVEILKEQIKAPELDIPIVKFVLRRLGQFDNLDGLRLVFKHINKLYPVFTDIVKYIHGLRALDETKKKGIGNALLGLIDNSLVGHLEFHRLWIFNTFTKNLEWDNEDKFVKLYKIYSDSFSRRELILALGRANHKPFFKANKRVIDSLGPWQRRAFLAAASCLPGDEYKHWYKSILHSLDPLERAIGKWVKAKPF